jgi:hypothetical protein
MLRKSKFRYIASISLSFAALDLAPAVAGGCGFDGCGSGYIVQQVPNFYGRRVSGLAQYCDGYGGGQNPYAICSVGGIKYIPSTRPIPSTHPPPFTVAKTPAPLPDEMPMVTKYNANHDAEPLSPPALVTKAQPVLSGELPIVTKYRANGH